MTSEQIVSILQSERREGSFNGDHIVRAVNAHGDLVAAMREAKDRYLPHWQPEAPNEVLAKHNLLQRIEAALAKAEAKS